MRLHGFRELTPRHFETCWRAPANIAFVKYWGKKGPQLPANPSLSMTLKECSTTSSVVFAPNDSLQVRVLLDGQDKKPFASRIRAYLLMLAEDLPWLREISVHVDTTNTFPHGAGVASSASGLSAFALCLTDYLYHLHANADRSLFLRQASELARLASGSACRSVFGGFVTWGRSEVAGSTDAHATPLAVHSQLSELHDSVLIVSTEEKQISSSQGHERLERHLFADARYHQARQNFTGALAALREGDMGRLGEVLEGEALSLHAMMMTSPAPYTLLRPGSIRAMELVREFRRNTGAPLYFTLDAGPNLHLVYPPSHAGEIRAFVNGRLADVTQRIIHDGRGEGPVRC